MRTDLTLDASQVAAESPPNWVVAVQLVASLEEVTIDRRAKTDFAVLRVSLCFGAFTLECAG